MVDEISITGQETEDAETDTGWTFASFRVTSSQELRYYANYYVVEYRVYWGYDKNLQVGPYNFGFLDNPELGNWGEHLPYQDGMLINYWDTSQSNNQVNRHPGQGLILPVEAHPTAMIRADGGVWRNRMQSYDSTFTLSRPIRSPCSGLANRQNIRAYRLYRCLMITIAITTASTHGVA